MAVRKTNKNRTSEFSSDGTKTLFRLLFNDNCLNLDNLTTDEKRAHEAYALDTILDVHIENNINLIPYDVVTLAVKSGFIMDRLR